MNPLINLIPLVIFTIIIGAIFMRILTTTKSLLIFLSILFAGYIIFRYVMQQTVVYFEKPELPVATTDDLAKYNSEYGVELREYQEQFQSGGGCGCSGLNNSDNIETFESNCGCEA